MAFEKRQNVRPQRMFLIYVFLNDGAYAVQSRIKLGTPGCKYDCKHRVLYPNAKSAHSKKLCRLCAIGFRCQGAKLMRETPSGRFSFLCFNLSSVETHLLKLVLIFSLIGTKQSSHRSIHSICTFTNQIGYFAAVATLSEHGAPDKLDTLFGC